MSACEFHSTDSARSSLALVVLKELWELLLKGTNFGAVADQDVRVIGIMERVVLMVGLRIVEALQWDYLSDDRSWEDSRCIELSDISRGNPVLLPAGVKDGSTIRGAHVGALPVQLRGIVRD